MVLSRDMRKTLRHNPIMIRVSAKVPGYIFFSSSSSFSSCSISPSCVFSASAPSLPLSGTAFPAPTPSLSRSVASEEPFRILLDSISGLRPPNDPDFTGVVDATKFDPSIEVMEPVSCAIPLNPGARLPGCRCSSKVAPAEVLGPGLDEKRSAAATPGKLPSVEWDASCRSGGFAASTASKNRVWRVEDVAVGDGVSGHRVPDEEEGEVREAVLLDLC